MIYTIEIKHLAEKFLETVSKDYYLLIKNAINGLKDNPRPHGYKKLAGFSDLYRIRVGIYRIIYSIQDKKLYIEILKISHRKEIYRNL